MADKKISQLTGASTPLAGTEVLPIVQSGSTVKVSAADITAGRNISAAGVTISGGTVDGVVYLNASKAATTGGSFVFNGTNMGIGTGSPDNLGRLTTEGSGNSLNVTRTSSTTNRAGWVAQNTAETIRLFSEVYGASATNTGWGLTLAGYSVIQSTGTSSNGLVIGTSTSDPIIFGTADTNRGQFDTSGNLKIENGNLVVGTAGKGIDFSAVTDGPGTVITEVLPSYVAGYYNTSMAASTSGTITLGYKTLAYVKVGRMVTVTGEMGIDSVASPVGDISFVLPFTAGPSTGGRMGNSDFVVRAYSFAGGLTGTIYGSIVQNSTTCNLIKIEDFVGAGIASNLQAGTTFVFCFSYIAAS